LWNTGRSLLAFNYNTHARPWLSGSLVDPLTGALFLLGLASALVVWRAATNRLLLAWFAVGVLGTGVLSKYDYVSVSRLNHLVPLVCLFAGVAAERATQILEEHGPAQLARFAFPAVLVSCSVLARWGNLQRWFTDTPKTVPTSPSSVAIRIIEDARCETAPSPPWSSTEALVEQSCRHWMQQGACHAGIRIV
jgi:hypothetical protein